MMMIFKLRHTGFGMITINAVAPSTDEECLVLYKRKQSQE